MTQTRLLFTMALLSLELLFPQGSRSALFAEPETVPAAQTPASPPDVLTLKDGSKVVGKITSMESGDLTVKTAFGGDIKVKWAEIETVESKTNQKLMLSDGSLLVGSLESDGQGNVLVTTETAAGPVTVPLESVQGVNPPPKKEVVYKANINAGGSISDGNTRNKTLSMNADFVATAKRNRLTLRGNTNYTEANEGLTGRNSYGAVKYDFFLNERFYLFIGAFLEGDEFQDLKLRSALSSGLGYQWFKEGDHEAELFKDLELYTEAGLAYFNEDFDPVSSLVGPDPDDAYTSGRWAARLDWPVSPDRITVFHFHEGFPGLENADDLFIRSEQGLRLTIIDNFVATMQVNWRWDNTPSPGNRRSDTLYLFTLGYAVEM